MNHGYDPTRPVRVDPATRPGQHAIVEQTMVKHLDADGNVVAYSWLSMAIEHADFQVSNRNAIAIAEKLNQGFNAPQTDADAEQDDG